MPGHLRATCPILRDEAMQQAKKEDQQKEEDILVMESAEPLPIVHDDGCLRWQNESVGQGRTDCSTAEGAGVSGSLEENIYNSKVKEEKLEAALTAAKARMAELEIMAAKLRDAGECLNLADMLDPPENLRPESLPPCETQVPWHTTSGSHLLTL